MLSDHEITLIALGIGIALVIIGIILLSIKNLVTNGIGPPILLLGISLTIVALVSIIYEFYQSKQTVTVEIATVTTTPATPLLTPEVILAPPTPKMYQPVVVEPSPYGPVLSA